MKRSHATINGTAIAKTAHARSYQSERAQRNEVGRMLAEAERKKFDLESVKERLDRANELDRLAMERRLASMPPPLDLGD